MKMESFVDRSERKLKSPQRDQMKKSGGALNGSVRDELRIDTEIAASSMASSRSPTFLTEEDIDQAVFSTTSIHMENKVSIDITSPQHSDSDVFSGNSPVEDEISIKASSPIKTDEEVRPYFTPGFAIRAWALEDVKHKDHGSSTIKHVEQKERKTSVTSTLTVNKHKDFQLENMTEVSSLSMNIGKSPKRETNTVEVTLNKPLDYDLEDRSPQKKEFSHLSFDIGKYNNNTEDVISKELFTEAETKSSTHTSTLEQNFSQTASKSLKTKPTETEDISNEWVVIEEQSTLNTQTSSSYVPTESSTVQSKTSEVLSAKVPLIPSVPVEVERKFTINSETEPLLVKLGAKAKSTKTFTDIYFDDDDYSLTLSDCWLRKRNNDYQMKIPVPNSPIFDHSTKYQELTNNTDILQFLKKKLGVSSNQLSGLIQTAKVIEFAKITTTRKTYSLNGCEIDLDMTDHGFQVGEIEVMVESPSQISEALRTIENMSVKLGLSSGKVIAGKLVDYLYKYNYTHYSCLVQNGVFKPIDDT